MALDTARIKALCFDLDGTLSDTDDQIVASIAQMLHWLRFFLPRRDSQAAARWLVMRMEGPGNFAYGLPDRFGIDDELAALGDWLFRRRGPRKRVFQIIPGVRECLTELKTKYPLALITARRKRPALEFLEQYNLHAYFNCIAGALAAPRTKPFPDPILWAARRLGVAPQDCLMIGDTTVDIRAGKAAGAQTVGVLSGFGEEEELRNHGADLILPSVADLPSHLLQN